MSSEKKLSKISTNRNFDTNFGKAACEAALWNLYTESSFALEPKKITDNLDVGQWQNLLALTRPLPK
jgi:hypothetical protein